MSKERWKYVTHSRVYEYALNVLNSENSQKSKTGILPPYNSLKAQAYFEYLCPADARLMFSVRGGTLDIKSHRKYNYEDGDTLCRLCGEEDETIGHIVNSCSMITRNDHVTDCYSVLKDDITRVLFRVKEFQRICEEKEDMVESD